MGINDVQTDQEVDNGAGDFGKVYELQMLIAGLVPAPVDDLRLLGHTVIYASLSGYDTVPSMDSICTLTSSR